MLAFQVLQALLNFFASLLAIALQAVLFAAGYLLVFVGGTGLGRTRQKRRGWLERFAERRRDREATFADVVGLTETKRELQQLIDLLKRPDAYREVGAELPRGAILVGPPGTGKTLLARAIANEAGVPFFSLASADFANMFLGVGAFRIRQVYRQARRHRRAIVFIDEVEALARTRSADFFGGDANTLSAFLTELDGFAVEGRVVTLAATNLIEQVDPAILRPGRLDWQIYIGPPTEAERKELFTYYLQRVRSEADPEAAARLAVNFTPAEVRRAVNEAALLAARSGSTLVGERELVAGVDRVAATLERRVGSFVIARAGDPTVHLSDVIGCDEAKAEVQEFIDYLRTPERYRQIGARVPRGILFVGPPGTGKTLLARAIANEAGVPFYALAGSDFVQGVVGSGAAHVRQVYAQARKHAAAIVFIDEIDALGVRRGTAGSEADQALNQLLVELDGFARSNVLTVGATNRLAALDAALVRPGRLDRTVAVPLPDLEARAKLFSHYLGSVRAVEGINCRQLARTSWNMSGADIAAAVNEASFLAVRDGRDRVTQFDLNQGIERVAFGLSSRRKVNAEDRRLVAIHEAGHAVVEHHARPERILHKLTIVPDLAGTAGYSWSVHDEERLSFETREGLLAELRVLFGGIVAEELFFGTMTIGSTGDLDRAASLAHFYIWNSGMHPDFSADYQAMERRVPLAETTRVRLDRAVEAVLVEARTATRTILEAHRDEHARLVAALLESESLYGEDILRVLRGEPHGQPHGQPQGQPHGLTAFRAEPPDES